MKRTIAGLMLAGGVFMSAHLSGADSAHTPKGSDLVKINFKGMKINEFIQMVSRITHKNILVGQKIQGVVDYEQAAPIRKDQIYALLVSVLGTKGYTIVDSGEGFLKVVRSADAVRNAPPLYGTSQVHTVQTAIIPVRNMNVRNVLRQVNFLLSKYGKITLSYENNTVVVSDYPENIRSIRNVIHRLDTDKRLRVRIYPLKNADAKSVYPKIKKIASALYDNKIQTQKVDIFEDEGINAIIVTAHPSQIRELGRYIHDLDKGNETIDKKMAIIYVKNADAVKIVKTLEKLLSDKSFARGEHPGTPALKKTVKKTTVPGIKGKKPVTTTTTETLPAFISSNANKPTVTVDEELNAVVVYATEREIKEIRRVVEQLDTERKQVYVTARILEISKNKASAIGAKYGIIGGITSSTGLYGFSGQIGSTDGNALGTITTLKGLLGDSLAIPTVKKALALGTAIDLYKKNGAADIISEPSILCINNKESSIYAGKTVSVLTEATTGADATSLTRQNYTREDIGLTLKVKPRISADNKVSMEIKTILEDVVGGQVGLPTTTKREVTTTSIVRNGESVIIGGLVKNKVDKKVSKIPLLGDIPILGIPFRHVSKEGDQLNLIIMITPYIVNRSEDLSRLREALGQMNVLERELAEKFEEQFNKNPELMRARLSHISPESQQKPVSLIPEVQMQETTSQPAPMVTQPHTASMPAPVVHTLAPAPQERREAPAPTKRVSAPPTPVEPSVEYLIDERGRAYRVTTYPDGRVVRKRIKKSMIDADLR